MRSLLISNWFIIIYICDDHVKYLSFKWSFSLRKFQYFAFQVLPFGLSSVPYIFSKVMRLFKHWRSKGYIVLFYLDDRIRGAYSLDQAKELSRILRNDVIKAGFILSAETSNWDPHQEFSVLGYISNFESEMIYVSERRSDKLRSSLAKTTSDNSLRIRSLASIVGQIISMLTAVGNIVRLMTRLCYAAIEKRSF